MHLVTESGVIGFQTSGPRRLAYPVEEEEETEAMEKTLLLDPVLCDDCCLVLLMTI